MVGDGWFVRRSPFAVRFEGAVLMLRGLARSSVTEESARAVSVGVESQICSAE